MQEHSEEGAGCRQGHPSVLRATTYLRGRVHLLGTVGCQGDLATLAAWRCALHHQTLCGESLQPGERGGPITLDSLRLSEHP